MLRRPRVSENEDHQSGKMDMASMYNATVRFTIVGDALRSFDISGKAANRISVSLLIFIGQRSCYNIAGGI